jgi:methionine--tRNA ligase beta chain
MAEKITFNDFLKVEIKLGQIESAEPIKDSYKLLKLIVDFGDFKKQIIAGIGDVYKSEELVGMKIPVVTNLEPKEMFGYESQGMILAVGNKKVSSLLIPDKEANPGENIN